MKAKTAFESGNSPPKVTGHGLESVRLRIMEAFEKIHNGQPAPTRQPKVEFYTEHQEARFRARADSLMTAASKSPHLTKGARDGVFEVAVPNESAEELILEAVRSL